MKIPKVLIVDDLGLNRRLLRAICESGGMETLEAEDGEDALELMKSITPDAIISDILMPRMDGYRFCKEVRSNPKTAAIPFIIYTSTYVSAGEEAFALVCGADKYLKKPVPAEDLLRILRGLIAAG